MGLTLGDNLGKMVENCMKITKSTLGDKIVLSGCAWGDKPVF